MRVCGKLFSNSCETFIRLPTARSAAYQPQRFVVSRPKAANTTGKQIRLRRQHRTNHHNQKTSARPQLGMLDSLLNRTGTPSVSKTPGMANDGAGRGSGEMMFSFRFRCFGAVAPVTSTWPGRASGSVPGALKTVTLFSSSGIRWPLVFFNTICLRVGTVGEKQLDSGGRTAKSGRRVCIWLHTTCADINIGLVGIQPRRVQVAAEAPSFSTIEDFSRVPVELGGQRKPPARLRLSLTVKRSRFA